MPAPLKTEAIVLRSIRFGEADRIIHLYTPHHGRLGAIAKGALRLCSRAARASTRGARLFETPAPPPEVFRLLANELALLCGGPAHAGPGNGLAFRLK